MEDLDLDCHPEAKVKHPRSNYRKVSC